MRRVLQVRRRAQEVVVQCVIARVGKEVVLPQLLGQPPPDLHAQDIQPEAAMFRPKFLGASVEIDD